MVGLELSVFCELDLDVGALTVPVHSSSGEDPLGRWNDTDRSREDLERRTVSLDVVIGVSVRIVEFLEVDSSMNISFPRILSTVNGPVYLCARRTK